MSELLKEAVIEAKKIKEVAEIDAKNKIIEAVAPIIKKMISEEVSGINKEEFLFKEEDDAVLPASQPAEPTVGADNANVGAPIVPVGGTVLDLPMPSSDGMVFTFDQLWQLGSKEPGAIVTPETSSAAEATAPIDVNQPVASTQEPNVAAANQTQPAVNAAQETVQTVPEETIQPPMPSMGESIDRFKKEVGLIAEKIGYVYFRKSTPAIVKENIKFKLFELCEELDLLEEKCLITPKQARLAENKLNFLFKKLEESKIDNIYGITEGDNMSNKVDRLEKFAAQLFEEETKEEMKVTEQQMRKDLLENAPASTAFGDGKEAVGAETASPDVHNPDALAKEKGDNSILENAPASSAFGDGEKAKGAETASPDVHNPDALADKEGDNTILEISDAELQEEVRKLRKESILRKLKNLRENAKLTDKDADTEDAGHEEGKPVAKAKESHKIADANNPKAKKPMVECGMMEDDGVDVDVEDVDLQNDEVELTFKVNLKDLEQLLADAEDGEVEMDLDMSGEDESEDDSFEVDSEEDEEIEIEDDEEESDDDDDEEKVLMDDEKSMKEMAYESRKAKPGSLLVEKKVKELQAQLVENQLLTAKALYLNKFSMREDLSRKQKQKIAEYLDRATTLAEAKETYNKIKTILEEAKTERKSTGTSGQTVTKEKGSASVITESQNHSDVVDVGRWAILANIKKTK